ncbi:MAG TPA: PKD domain-containing protein [Myxococcales bacterium]
MIARRALYAVALAPLLLASCAHRFPARTGGEREAVAGLPVSFGPAEQEQVPAGTRILWDFGDGSTAEGPTASHAWRRAGEYTLKIEVVDEKGTRSDQSKVRVARRPPATAVPPSARAALIVDRFFARLPQHLAVAERLAGPERTRKILETLERVLGFDPSRPEQVLASGVDPEEGLALAWMPQDTGTWLIVGIFDERAALEAARTAFARQEQVGFTPGPGNSTIAEVGKARIQFGTSGGYLYMHLGADEQSQSGLDFASPCPPTGLLSDAEFARLRAQVAGDDAFLFVRGSEIPKRDDLGKDLSELRAHAGALAAGLSNRENVLSLQARLTFDPLGQEVLARTFVAPGKVELDAQAPAGAAAYLSVSLAAQAISDWMTGGDREKVDQALGSAGLRLDSLAAAVSGGVALAAYFDLATVLREVAGGGSPKLLLVGGMSLKDPQDAKRRLDEAAAAGNLEPSEVGALGLRADGVWRFKGADPSGVALSNGAALFGHQAPLAKTLDPSPDARRLSTAVRAAVPEKALAAGHQLLFLDVAGFVDQLRNPVLPGGDVDSPRQKQLAMMMAAMVESAPELQPFLPVRDFYADLFRDEGSLALEARLRLR